MTISKTTSGRKSGKKIQEECKNSELCPIHRLVSLLTGPWTTYILWLIRSAENSSQRFGELKKAIPAISAKVLTERLRMLENEGIIDRFQEETIPPKVTYSLTKQGKELNHLLDEINRLAKKWYDGHRAKSK